MNFYEEILREIKIESKKHNCPFTVGYNPKKEKALKGKTFEQVQKEAAEYGLFLTWNDNFNMFYDTHTYVFSTSPLDKYGFPVELNFNPDDSGVDHEKALLALTNIYLNIRDKIDEQTNENNCPCSICVDPSTEDSLKNKTFDQAQKEAAEYGLYITLNYSEHSYGTTIVTQGANKWIFSKIPT